MSLSVSLYPLSYFTPQFLPTRSSCVVSPKVCDLNPTHRVLVTEQSSLTSHTLFSFRPSSLPCRTRLRVLPLFRPLRVTLQPSLLETTSTTYDQVLLWTSVCLLTCKVRFPPPDTMSTYKVGRRPSFLTVRVLISVPRDTLSVTLLNTFSTNVELKSNSSTVSLVLHLNSPSVPLSSSF